MPTEDSPRPKVLNRRDSGVPSGAVYVGRPSRWGNVYKIGRDGTRAGVLQLYREWLWFSDNGAFRQKVKEQLRGKDLVCWCAPGPCHADVLLEVANESRPTL